MYLSAFFCESQCPLARLLFLFPNDLTLHGLKLLGAELVCRAPKHLPGGFATISPFGSGWGGLCRGGSLRKNRLNTHLSGLGPSCWSSLESGGRAVRALRQLGARPPAFALWCGLSGTQAQCVQLCSTALPTPYPRLFSSLDFRNECQCNAVKKKKIQVNYCMET